MRMSLQARLQSIRARRAGGEAGAIDLASIMVGTLVIGIVGGVIAATVFAVVPWSQDSAAKQALSSVQTAQGVHYAFGTMEHQSVYADMPGLVTAKLIEPADGIEIALNEDATCFVAASLSETGSQFWTDSFTAPEITKYTDASTSNCAEIPNLTEVAGGPSDGLIINNMTEVNATANSRNGGNIDGRFITLEREGTWEASQVPYLLEPATIASGREYAYGITDLHAWIGGEQVAISANLEDAALDWTLDAGYEYFSLSLENLVIGDNLSPTLRAFLNTGALTFKVKGSELVNTFIMGVQQSTGAPVGNVAFPPALDGTFVSGDVTTLAPTITGTPTGYTHYTRQANVILKADGSPTPVWTVTDGQLPPGTTLNGVGKYPSIYGFATAPLQVYEVELTATNSAGSDSQWYTISPQGASLIAGKVNPDAVTYREGTLSTNEALQSRLTVVKHMAAADDGTLYVTESKRIRKFDAGKPHQSSTLLNNAAYTPNAIAVSRSGVVYFSQGSNIYSLTGTLNPVPQLYATVPGGRPITDLDFGGTGVGTLYVSTDNSVYKYSYLYANLELVASGFSWPVAISVDSAGWVFLADNSSNIKMINPVGGITVVAGSGGAGLTDHATNALQAELTASDIEVADNGNIVFIQGTGATGGKLRTVTMTNRVGTAVTTITSSGGTNQTDAVNPSQLWIYYAKGLAIGSGDAVYYAGGSLNQSAIHLIYGLTGR